MNDDFDFESNLPNNGPINNGPVNNTSMNNNGPINNGSNKGSGGVPLIAIIGVMALIILGLIIYIIVDPKSTKDEAVNVEDFAYQVDDTETSFVDMENVEEVDDEVEEEPVDEDELNIENIKDAQTDTNKDTEKTKTPIATTNSPKEPVKLSDDWKSCEFAVEGKKYILNDAYSKFKADGWYIDLEGMGYSAGYILNKNDKTYSTIDLLNDKFEDAEVSVGFINNGESAQDVTECAIWAFGVDNSYTDTPVDFELPGGIKSGSTLAEIEAAYGKPEADDIYVSESLGYTNYTYSYDYSIYLDLTVYNDKGLVEFDYKIY